MFPKQSHESKLILGRFVFTTLHFDKEGVKTSPWNEHRNIGNALDNAESLHLHGSGLAAKPAVRNVDHQIQFRSELLMEPNPLDEVSLFIIFSSVLQNSKSEFKRRHSFLSEVALFAQQLDVSFKVRSAFGQRYDVVKMETVSME